MDQLKKNADHGSVLWTAPGYTKFHLPLDRDDDLLKNFAESIAERVNNYHRSFDEYAKTPLVTLSNLSDNIGLGQIFVKDESFRFGLNAFKVLGASYAIARTLGERLSIDSNDLSCGLLTSAEMREKIKDIVFATTTDGNHGRGVAWTARRLGVRAKIFMPKGTEESRVRAIADLGADVAVRDVNYDESVAMTAEEAEHNGWVLVQDTAWEGYEKIPLWIMQGYMTLFRECAIEIEEKTSEGPTHLFVQAGVGSLAAAAAAYLKLRYHSRPPKIIIVEPNEADCFYRSAAAGDGVPRVVGGDMPTMMAGLACGCPSISAFEILRKCADVFISCPDRVAARGMRILGAPLRGDERIISGESGASTAGMLYEIMTDDSLSALRITLGLNKRSSVLLFSTEGDTCPDNYLKVVWDGALTSV